MIRQLAEVAHECWCESMHRKGWRHAAEYDPAARTHDALVPFSRLKRCDQQHACNVVGAEGIELMLAKLISYPRGPERPFLAEELTEGLQVGLAKDLDPSGTQRGRVRSWSLTAEGDVEEIKVSWADGEESSHQAAECELRRVAPR